MKQTCNEPRIYCLINTFSSFFLMFSSILWADFVDSVRSSLVNTIPSKESEIRKVDLINEWANGRAYQA